MAGVVTSSKPGGGENAPMNKPSVIKAQVQESPDKLNKGLLDQEMKETVPVSPTKLRPQKTPSQRQAIKAEQSETQKETKRVT